MEKLWAGRAAKHLDQIADDFNASIRFDQRLAVEDLTGSMAHAAMLGAKGINSPEDTETILAGLESILLEAVSFPQAAAGPVTDHSMSQFLAGGDAHPVDAQAVAPGIKDHVAIGIAIGGIEPAEYVVEL